MVFEVRYEWEMVHHHHLMRLLIYIYIYFCLITFSRDPSTAGWLVFINFGRFLWAYFEFFFVHPFMHSSSWMIFVVWSKKILTLILLGGIYWNKLFQQTALPGIKSCYSTFLWEQTKRCKRTVQNISPYFDLLFLRSNHLSQRQFLMLFMFINLNLYNFEQFENQMQSITDIALDIFHFLY